MNIPATNYYKEIEINKLLSSNVNYKKNYSRFKDITSEQEAKTVPGNKNTEQHLKESEERYRTLIETSPDAILMFDLIGCIVMSNKRAAEMFGCEDVGQLHGTSIFNYVDGNGKKKIFLDAEMVGEYGIRKHAEYTLCKRGGGKVPVEVNASLVLDLYGKPDAIVCIIRDITARKAAEASIKNSEIMFRSVWENSFEGMRLTNAEGIIIAANQAYCTMVGKNEIELRGKYFTEIYSLRDNIDYEQMLAAYKEQFNKKQFKTFNSSRYYFNNNEEIELDETYSFISPDKWEPLLLGIYHNVTERKRAEEELKKSEQLAEIGKQTAFLSHEIKTPLASIKMNIDMLYKSLDIPEDKQKSFLIVQKEVQRLAKLLKSVLQFSRVPRLVFTPVNLKQLIENIKDFLTLSFEGKNIIFKNNVVTEKMLGDYKVLQTVFLHMLENSVDAIENDGIIEIISFEDSIKDELTVLIKDTGCGVDTTRQIFEPFITTKSSGTGLGLTIAKNLIEQHNGSLKLLSSQPGETVFEIIFHNNSKLGNG